MSSEVERMEGIEWIRWRLREMFGPDVERGLKSDDNAAFMAYSNRYYRGPSWGEPSITLKANDPESA